MTEPPTGNPTPPPPVDGPTSPPPATGPGFVDRMKPIVQPLTERAWLNMRVWVPFLANPQMKVGQVRYAAREGRDGTQWNVTLPAQCWQCGAKESLLTREYQRELRSFDAPLAILAGALGGAFFLFLLGGFWSTFYLLALACLVGGAAMMFVKSWPEQVRLSIASCAAHADQVRCPDLVVYDNELYVFAPSAELAQTARAEIIARRRSEQRYASPEERSARAPAPPLSLDAPAASPSGPTSTTAPRPAAGYKRGELPPIKLDE
jgi:hypothetical protein